MINLQFTIYNKFTMNKFSNIDTLGIENSMKTEN